MRCCCLCSFSPSFALPICCCVVSLGRTSGGGIVQIVCRLWVCRLMVRLRKGEEGDRKSHLCLRSSFIVYIGRYVYAYGDPYALSNDRTLSSATLQTYQTNPSWYTSSLPKVGKLDTAICRRRTQIRERLPSSVLTRQIYPAQAQHECWHTQGPVPQTVLLAHRLAYSSVIVCRCVCEVGVPGSTPASASCGNIDSLTHSPHTLLSLADCR